MSVLACHKSKTVHKGFQALTRAVSANSKKHKVHDFALVAASVGPSYSKTYKPVVQAYKGKKGQMQDAGALASEEKKIGDDLRKCRHGAQESSLEVGPDPLSLWIG